jgi:hypothetical protein
MIQFLKKSDNGNDITYSYSDSIVSQRRIVENEWKKVENEWKKVENELKKEEEETFKCEITNKPKRPGTVDCNCKYVCMAKISEIFIIHYEGGIGIISKK